MGVPLSAEAQAFLREKVFAHVATLMRDGSPHSTIVWVDTDGTNVVVNSSTDRVKLRNMKRDGRVAISISAADDEQRVLYVRGRVSSISEDEGFEHIDSLARKYRGQDQYPRERLEGQTRLRIVIEPLHVVERLRRRE